MINYHIVSPVYGRDYKFGIQAKMAWLNGLDFVYESINNVPTGKYCSKRNFGQNDIIEIRFNRKTDFTLVRGDE